MSQSSLGFHTLTISMILLDDECDALILDFKKYSQKAGDIQMYSNEYGNLVMKFHKEDKGIEWLIRFNVWHEKLMTNVNYVEIKINPKILSGIRDYITAADIYDMNVAIINFNRISKNVSPLLRTFDDYFFKRIDYCINFSLDELAPGCSHELIMKLIRHGDIPPHYEEWKKYDEKAHQKKSRPSSFYLICDSVNINCYSKYMKFQEQNEGNIKHGRPPISQQIMDMARDIVRFEVQCKYQKVYNQSRKIGNIHNAYNTYRVLLGYQTCLKHIYYYFNVTIGTGDWYSLSAAKEIIKERGFNKQKTERLINVLQEVNQCRSLAKAKAKHQGSDLEAFKRTVKDLADIGINPVTIPREWGIPHIPNLLHTFYDKHPEARPGITLI